MGVSSCLSSLGATGALVALIAAGMALLFRKK